MREILGTLLLTVSFLIARPCPAASSLETFKSAGESYEQGDFDRAVSKYEQLVREGIVSPELYFNLGSAHFRLGNRGESILWFERARRLKPRDRDISHNLDLARSKLQDGEGNLWESLDRLIAPCELSWLVTGLFWALCGVAGLGLLLRQPWRRWRLPFLTTLIFLIISSLWLGGRIYDLRAPWGVIIRAGTEVRSGPGEQFAVGFTIPSGQRVLVLGRRANWTEIGVPSRSLKGWVTEGAAELIRPADGWVSPM